MRFVLLVFALGGCTQPTLSHDWWSGNAALECSDAGTYVCKGDTRARCELDLLAQRDATGCTADSDCVAVELAPERNCLSYGECQPYVPVLRANEGRFRAEATAYLRGYCEWTMCKELAQCPLVSARPVCVSGRCASQITDAGP